LNFQAFSAELSNWTAMSAFGSKADTGCCTANACPLISTPNGDARSVLSASYNFKAEIEVPQSGAEGMLITQGGRFGGYGFYMLKGKPKFVWNMVGLSLVQWEGHDALAPGKHTVELDFKYEGMDAATMAFGSYAGIGRGGTDVLRVDGKDIVTQKMERTIPFILQEARTGAAQQQGDGITKESDRRCVGSAYDPKQTRSSNVQAGALTWIKAQTFEIGQPSANKLFRSKALTMRLRNSTEGYGAVSQIMHWLTVALVILAWLLGQFDDIFPKGAARAASLFVHNSAGLAVIAILVLRLFWRFTNQPPPLEHTIFGEWLDRLGRLTHYVLYALLIAAPISGIVLQFARGDALPIFGLTEIASPWTADRAFARNVKEVHELMVNALVILAALHAAAALVHHWVLRDRTLVRMLPHFWQPYP
jgi:cytochrome b561